MAISRQQLPKTTDKKQKKVSKVMREFKKGKLNIGNAQKMANGEVEYQATVRESNDKGWKDEFVLILISLPILLLIWSVFSDDPSIQEKIDIFFDKFANLPFWYQSLFIGVVASIYGLKGADIFKKK
jgi:uncharacterized ion transporter superfamily protein YfcC